MVKYICRRCGYQVNHKHNYIKHLSRKKPCKVTKENVDIDSLKQEINVFLPQNPSKIEENNLKMPQNASFVIKKVAEMPQNASKNEGKVTKTLECDYCHKLYSRKDNLRRHMYNCQKKNTSNQNELITLFKEQIAIMKEEHAKEKQELKKEISQLLEKVGSVTNITHQQNNIYINSYGQENIDYISSNYLNKLIKSPFGAVPKLIKYVHFNPKHPENHNVKITNKKLPYASVWEGNKWTVKDKKEVIENIVDKSFSIIDDHYQVSGDTSQKYINFQQKYNKGEKNIVKIINKDTELLMVNNASKEHLNL